ncbi:immunity repressor [Mycobacterium phage Cracklewink]|nr:immunity repressor [Mycobacterium phage Cracklewink]
MTSAYEQGTIPPSRLKYRLRIAREEADLDQQQLAELMGVSRHVVSNAERGMTTPRKVVLNAWALACGVPVSWLEKGIGGWEPPPADDAVRPKGLEPLTFCFVTRPKLSLVSSVAGAPDGQSQQSDCDAA